MNQMSETELETLKQNVRESLSASRHRMLVDFPFTGAIIMRMNLIPVRDVRLRTAATDGNNIFVDIAFYSSLTGQHRLTVLAHEVWHCVMMHFLRQQSRETELFNIAADMEVDYLLSTQKYNIPEFMYMPEKAYQGQSAEEIYEILLKDSRFNSRKNKKSQSNGGPGGSSQKSGDSNSFNNEQQNKSSQFDKHITRGNEPETKSGPYTGDDNDADTSNRTLPGYENAKSPTADKFGEKGFDADYSPRISEDVANKIRQAVITASQDYERMQGHLPAGLEKYIKELKKPEIRWQEQLQQFVTTCYGGSRQWLPVNRRYISRGLYMQSQRNERVNVCVAIDTSGSTTNDLPKFMTELVGLLNSFGDYNLTVIQCDMSIQSVEQYDNYNEFNVHDTSKYKFKGFGGTSFCPVFEYVDEHGLMNDHSCLIYFTDGFGDAPKNPPPYPVLWVLTSDGTSNFCDWGQKLKFKKKNETNNQKHSF